MSLCRTCFDICERDYSILIEAELKNMLIFCIPELDLDITEKPVLCKECQTTLISVNEFKKKCLHTQQKILIFKNQSVEHPPVHVKLTPVPPKVVEKVSPFKLKLGTDQNNSDNKNMNLRKRSYSEYGIPPVVKDNHIKSSTPFVTDPVDNDQEDFLSLLDNSDNVSNPKIEVLRSLKKTEVKTDVTKSKQNTSRGFDCKLCKKSYKNKYHLKVHKTSSVTHRSNMAKLNVVQTTGPRYKCDSCSFSTKYKIGLNKHYPNCPNKKTTSISPGHSNDTKKAGSKLTCRICSYQAFNNSVLAIHMSKKHNTAWNTYKCNFCSCQTTTVLKLREHKNKMHPMEYNILKSKIADKIEEKVKIFTCRDSNCRKGFRSRKGWLNHEKKHSSSVSRECHICKKKFENGRGFKQHVESHTESKGVNTKLSTESSPKGTSKRPVQSWQKKKSDKEIGNTINSLVERLKTTQNETKRMSGLQEITENSQAMSRKVNGDVIHEQSANSLQIKKQPFENENPLSEVEFVGIIMDEKDNSPMTSNVKNHTERETVSPTNNLEEEYEDLSTLSQGTIILDENWH